MPAALVTLFWIWFAMSVCVYIYRAANRKPKVEETETDTTTDELPLDSPERWAPAKPGDAETGVPQVAANEVAPAAETAADPASPEQAAEQATPEPEAHEIVQPSVAAAATPPDAGDRLPVSEIASRLDPLATDPLVTTAEIEPSVLAAMNPTQRASVGGAAAAQATGGLFDPQVRETHSSNNATFDHAPLSTLLSGIAMPCDLLPKVGPTTNDHHAVFATCSAAEGVVAAAVATELERLGFDVSPKPPSGAVATRDSSAVDIVVSAHDAEAPEAGTEVQVEFTSL